jgi:hypothetical protein
VQPPSDTKTAPAIGFAGLESLVSDGAAEAQEIRRLAAAAGSVANSKAGHARARPPFWLRLTRALRAAVVELNVGTAIFLVLLLAIGGAIAVNGKRDNTGQSQTSSTPTNPVSAPPQSSQPSAPAKSPESMPPAGTDLVLNSGNLHYCLAEQVRVDAAEAHLAKRDHYSITRFNENVDDYNSRCAQFKYRHSDMDKAQSWIEEERSALVSEGEERARDWLRRSRKQSGADRVGAPLT